MFNEEKRDEGCEIYDSGWAFSYIADSKARMGWRNMSISSTERSRPFTTST